MKVKLDENLPVEVAAGLRAEGLDVDTVQDEGLAGHVDADVWREAQASGRFFVTQDLDFSDIRRFAPGTHYGVLLVRLGAPSRRELIARIVAAFTREDVEPWNQAFVVLTETKLRVRTSEVGCPTCHQWKTTRATVACGVADETQVPIQWAM